MNYPLRQLVSLALAMASIAAITSQAQSTNSPHSWNVLDSGALGDGKTDCTAAFQKVLDAAGKAGGGIVDVPAGRYRIETHLSIPANVTLQGIFRGPPTSPALPAEHLTGSVLLAFAGRYAPHWLSLPATNMLMSGK